MARSPTPENNQLISTHIKTTTLAIKGITCESCALGVEYPIKQVPGVIEADGIYKEGKGTVTYDADQVSPDTIAEASEAYPVTIIDGN